MTPLSAYCLCVAIILGLCSASIQPPRNSTYCPTPCLCQNSSISCTGCPTNYITISDDIERLYIKGCKDIQYLLRLHRHEANSTKLTLNTLEIRDSYVRQPESFIYSDFNIKSLLLPNNSINRVSSDLRTVDVTYLDLSSNTIEYIDNRTFTNMKNLVFLDISANRVVRMDTDSFSGLGKLLHLNLSHNNLTLLNDSVFSPLESLQQLNLSMNRITVISEKTFSSLLLLQQLDLSYNRLMSVAPGTLQFLPNLARLLLGDNPQLRPDAQIFVGTGRRLQQVDASRTGLSQIPEALTHSVRYLTLAGNQIETVRRGDLDSYPLLHMLDFTDNILVDIEDDALGRLEMLSQLYLNRNKMLTVPKMLPDKLEYLSIDSNFITNLTTVDFAVLNNLKVLILSNNRISYIQENTFITLVSLEALDLSNNPLKALTPNTFSGPISLKDLRMAYVNISPPAKDISFPVPSPEGIENLHLEFSPGLTRQLMADTAALAAMTRLQHLDVRFSNLTNIRSDLLHFLPELKTLKLDGNKLNCTDISWLADWMTENPQSEDLKCYYPKQFGGRSIVSLRSNEAAIPNGNEVDLKTAFVLQKKNGNSSIKVDQTNKSDIKTKLLKIFSEWSEESTAKVKKADDPCGSSNGSECVQHPAATLQDAKNNASRFMYRKIENEIVPTNATADNEGAVTVSANVSDYVIERYNSSAEVHIQTSVYQTSRYRAESAASGNLGVVMSLLVLTAAAAGLATAWAARRRPRRRQDIMEVPTIAAVGELW